MRGNVTMRKKVEIHEICTKLKRSIFLKTEAFQENKSLYGLITNISSSLVMNTRLRGVLKYNKDIY